LAGSAKSLGEAKGGRFDVHDCMAMKSDIITKERNSAAMLKP
jgi:hypothetical protein